MFWNTIEFASFFFIEIYIAFNHWALKKFIDLGFLDFQTKLSFIVLEEAEGSLIKQKLRRCRKGFGWIIIIYKNVSSNPEKSKVLIFYSTFTSRKKWKLPINYFLCKTSWIIFSIKTYLHYFWWKQTITILWIEE